MKTRFIEILKNYCDEYGETVEGVLIKDRKTPKPMIRAFTVRDYLFEYPNTPLRAIGKWLDMDHSTISYLRDNADQFLYNPRVKNYSSFVNFTFPTLFTYKING